MGLFYLLTLYCAIRAAQSRRPELWVAGSIAACALGMASKEAMVTAPIVVWLWYRIFSTRLAGPQVPSLKPQTLYIGLAATWFVLAALMLTHPRTHSVGFSFADWPWWRYLLTQAGVIVHYLRLAVVPTPLVLDYGWPPAATLLQNAPQVVALTAMFGLTVWAVWRRHPAGFLGGWLFLTLAPTSSVIPIPTEVAAEHRMYLPLAALVALAVVGAQLLLERASRPWARYAGPAAALALTATFITMVDARNRAFESDERIWLDTIEKRPANARARNNYAADLLERGDARTAEDHLRVAVSLDPRFAEAQGNLGVALCRQQKCNEGIPHLERALDLDPEAPRGE
jgi:hypothetical protein